MPASSSRHASSSPSGIERSRLIVFAMITLVCAVAGAGYAVSARWRAGRASTVTVPAADPGVLAAVTAAPHVLFLSREADGLKHAAVVPLDSLDGPRRLTAMTCERIYYMAGTGLCLASDRRGITRYYATIFDETFERTSRFDLPGLPSRARVSRDGRRVAFTVFVAGHSYATAGFSTRTEVIDASSATSLVELEQLNVTKDGAPIKAVDFNFWGVTFARDGQRFYATLSTGGQTHLVEGRQADRTARVLTSNAECPSLSPDETRIAYKKRVPRLGRMLWRVAVLDLTSGAERVLDPEGRNVDDQVEWLDEESLLYGMPDDRVAGRSNIWRIDADGSGAPQLFLANAESPAVVRAGPPD
jgi:hypothetical protein